MNDAMRFLIGELERLLSLPLDSKSKTDAWRLESERLQRELSARYPAFEFPHEIWHFLADADIRAHDPAYRESLKITSREPKSNLAKFYNPQ
jgi:hypothetical protein